MDINKKEEIENFGHYLDLDQTIKVYKLEGKNISWIDYSNNNEGWLEDKYYDDFDKWWKNLSFKKKEKIYNIMIKEDLIPKEYNFPYSIYKKYFPKGTISEFNKCFVTFDVSKKEFENIKKEKNYVCWETVVFDLNFIKTPLKSCYGTLEKNNIVNKFRKED